MQTPSRFVLALHLTLVISQLALADAKPPATHAVPVDVAAINATLPSQSLAASGRVTAHTRSEVRPQVTGIISKRLFEEGAQVEAGQPLYQLDDKIYRAEVASAKAKMDGARATLQSSLLKVKRAESLRKIDAVSQEEYDNLAAAFAIAKADLDAAEANYHSAQIDVDHATIKAPISGVVGETQVTEGALVTSNQTNPLVTIRDMSHLDLDISLSLTDAMHLAQTASGSEIPLSMTLSDGTRIEKTWSVSYIASTTDRSTGQVKVRLTSSVPDEHLMDNLFVQVEVSIPAPHGVLIPQRAVYRNAKGVPFVWVVNAQGEAHQRDVQLNGTHGNAWISRSGLDVGDQVVVSGVQRLKEGASVVIDPPAPEGDQ